MKKLIFAFLLMMFFACNYQEGKPTSCRICVHVSSAQGKMIYLYNVPFSDSIQRLIDSGRIKSADDSLIFLLPISDDACYYVEEKQSLNKFYFIPDSKNLFLSCNNINGKYEISGSVANISLKEYQDSIAAFLKRTRDIIIERKKNFNRIDPDKTSELKRSSIDNINNFKLFSKNFADTTSNSGVFLQVYNQIDFQNDFEKEKKYLDSALTRFPNSLQIKKLREDVYETAKIFEREFNVGDTIPFIQLPDEKGELFNTASLKGKYYLIDFWSTWCTNCLTYEKPKQIVANHYTKNFSIVSIALDDNISDWKKFINYKSYNSIQLIDKKMWRGSAAQTFFFDSIPFNFLVSPKGTILAKAIPADSLSNVLNNFVKQ